MNYLVTDPCGPGEELARKAIEYFRDAAQRDSIDLGEFDPGRPLHQQVAWAEGHGLSVGCTYLRYSSKVQHSSDDQLRENIFAAARLKIFIPAPLICLDEAKKGRSTRRAGLSRLKDILLCDRPLVLILFKLSRLFRNSYKGHEFIAERVVEKGHRAIVFSDGIDTADERAWKAQVQLRGILDDMYLDTLVDHVKAGLIGIFEKGWTVGPLGVGYRPKILPDAPLTNLGKPRTMPEVDPEAVQLIRQHFEWIRDGMPLREGLRRWLAAGGPFDPRSTTRRMTSTAYRRMLSNVRLTGRCEFGRNKTTWSSTKDYAVQQEQPDDEIATFQCESLRIVSDELFLAVQTRLEELKLGPRGPKTRAPAQLWDLTTEFFFCAACSTKENLVRFHQTGAHGRGMQCRNGDLCPSRSAVSREDAVRAVCEQLRDLIHRDGEMIEQVVCRVEEIDARGDDPLQAQIAAKEREVATLNCRLADLYELAGQGSEDDRKEVKARIRSTQAERTSARLELSGLKRRLAGTSAAITPTVVRSTLRDFVKLLEDGAAGKLGPDTVYKALAVFRRLTGGRIWVHVEQRPGRKQTNVRGVFQPQLIRSVKAESEQTDVNDDFPCDEVSVWLRPPPRLDALAERVHQLMDIDGLSYRQAANALRKEGHQVNSGNVWYILRRWCEMQGVPPHRRPYNGGQPRRQS